MSLRKKEYNKFKFYSIRITQNVMRTILVKIQIEDWNNNFDSLKFDSIIV